MRIKSVVFSFSLLLAAACLAQNYSGLAPKVRAAKTAGEAADIVYELPNLGKDDYLSGLADKAANAPHSVAAQKDLADAIEMRAMLEKPASNDSAAAAIKRIQTSPLYRKVDERRTSNWIGNTMEKIKKLFPKSKKPNFEGLDLPKGNWGDAVFRWAAWICLAGILIAFLAFAIRYWSFRRNLQRRASAVLEEDEPERTLDEWLVMADGLEKEGKYREAIRCLYLACLLKFDEAGIARFVRSHTNWEHLGRIQVSPKNPGIDFLPLTKAFDLAWYGFRVKGAEDVVSFREGYKEIARILEGMR